jgi:hypothetical protein
MRSKEKKRSCLCGEITASNKDTQQKDCKDIQKGEKKAVNGNRAALAKHYFHHKEQRGKRAVFSTGGLWEKRGGLCIKK